MHGSEPSVRTSLSAIILGTEGMIRVKLYTSSGGQVNLRTEIRHPRVRSIGARVDTPWHLRCKITELCLRLEDTKAERRRLKDIYDSKLHGLNAEYARLKARFDAMHAQHSMYTLRAQLALVSRDIRFHNLACAMNMAQDVIQLQARILQQSSMHNVTALHAGGLQPSIVEWRRGLAGVQTVLTRHNSMRCAIPEILQLVHELSHRMKRLDKLQLSVVNRL